MKNVPFFKSTAYGNNFVIVDETHTPILTEAEKSDFAYQATNINYGVGSDNFLVIQPCKPKILRRIHKARRYWNELPEAKTADYIFRMFEPDGKEAFCCANGLLCIAQYLNHRYGIESAQVMTEIPTATPKVVSIGTHPQNGTNWANLGHPRRISPKIADLSVTNPYDDVIDIIENIKITFRAHDLTPFSHEHSLKISGYLVFTGEPHLVVFSGNGFSLKQLPEMLFISSYQDSSKRQKVEKRVAFGSWLVHHIGTYLNKHYTHVFPEGMNINFVRIDKDGGALEFRCFERGINRETLACGTGALAVSFVARQLKLVETNKMVLWPHRCRWHDPEAQIIVNEDKKGWHLYGDPVMLFDGVFAFQKTLNQKKTAMSFEKPRPSRRFNLRHQSFDMRFLRLMKQRIIPFGSVSPMEGIGKASGHIMINRPYEELNL
jgi:diaminopimelate epimerase